MRASISSLSHRFALCSPTTVPPFFAFLPFLSFRPYLSLSSAQQHTFYCVLFAAPWLAEQRLSDLILSSLVLSCLVLSCCFGSTCLVVFRLALPHRRSSDIFLSALYLLLVTVISSGHYLVISCFLSSCWMRSYFLSNIVNVLVR